MINSSVELTTGRQRLSDVKKNLNTRRYLPGRCVVASTSRHVDDYAKIYPKKYKGGYRFKRLEENINQLMYKDDVKEKKTKKGNTDTAS